MKISEDTVIRAIGMTYWSEAWRGRTATPDSAAAMCRLREESRAEAKTLEWRHPVETSSKSITSWCRSSVSEIAKNNIANTHPNAAHSASGLRCAFGRWRIQNPCQTSRIVRATSSQRTLRNNSICLHEESTIDRDSGQSFGQQEPAVVRDRRTSEHFGNS